MMQTRERATGEGLHRYFQIRSVSSRLFKPWASIFYFFYKNNNTGKYAVSSQPCLPIASYKHGN